MHADHTLVEQSDGGWDWIGDGSAGVYTRRITGAKHKITTASVEVQSFAENAGA
jgi:hypothetical protein